MTIIETLNIVDARDVFSERVRSHFTAVFLDKAKTGALSADMLILRWSRFRAIGSAVDRGWKTFYRRPLLLSLNVNNKKLL
jgi:hypothetical protein